MEVIKSKVYIKCDPTGLITRCEGGYVTPNDLTGWTEVDEGTGDRYNLCQSHYFDGGLHTTDGIPRWKYADGVCSLRTDAEIQTDREALPVPVPQPTAQELQAQLEATQDMLDAILMGEITI